MFIVIFKAKINLLDEEYSRLAGQLRELATSKYGCVNFISTRENDLEVSLSYWEKEEDIVKWKGDPLHLHAQELGRRKWYKSYQIEVVEIKRSYPE